MVSEIGEVRHEVSKGVVRIGKSVEEHREGPVWVAFFAIVQRDVVECQRVVHTVTVVKARANLASVASLSSAQFKEVVGHFATGVVVVAATTETGPAGFTCQSFAALSLEPLLVTFAATTNGNSWPRIRDVGRVGISVLAEHHETVARALASSSPTKFNDTHHEALSNGAPGVVGALAHIEGDIVSVTTFGDHDIAVVAVTGLSSSSGRPLLYYRGGFGTFQS